MELKHPRVFFPHGDTVNGDWKAGEYGALVQFIVQDGRTYGIVALENDGAYVMAPLYALQQVRPKFDDLKHAVRRYTHDRSESGYDDVLGACGNPCKQCEKDVRFIEELKGLWP
jgi:hypothetical protein